MCICKCKLKKNVVFHCGRNMNFLVWHENLASYLCVYHHFMIYTVRKFIFITNEKALPEIKTCLTTAEKVQYGRYKKKIKNWSADVTLTPHFNKFVSFCWMKWVNTTKLGVLAGVHSSSKEHIISLDAGITSNLKHSKWKNSKNLDTVSMLHPHRHLSCEFQWKESWISCL